jgi:hypothetical protein
MTITRMLMDVDVLLTRLIHMIPQLDPTVKGHTAVVLRRFGIDFAMPCNLGAADSYPREGILVCHAAVISLA